MSSFPFHFKMIFQHAKNIVPPPDDILGFCWEVCSFLFFLLLGKVLFCGSFPDFSLVWLSGVMKMYLDIDCWRFGILCSLAFIRLPESVGLYLLSDLSSFQSLFLRGLFQPSPPGTLSILWSLIGSYSSLSLDKEGLCYLFLASSGWIFYGPLWIK